MSLYDIVSNEEFEKLRKNRKSITKKEKNMKAKSENLKLISELRLILQRARERIESAFLGMPTSVSEYYKFKLQEEMMAVQRDITKLETYNSREKK